MMCIAPRLLQPSLLFLRDLLRASNRPTSKPSGPLTGVAADCAPGASGTVNAADVLLTINLASWSLVPGTILVVSIAATGSFGEVCSISGYNTQS